jgi:peptide/nickel transport system permease protein
MTAYTLRRFVSLVPVVLGIMTVVFLALKLIPGDPALAMAGQKATPAEVERIREQLGLTRPLPVQYGLFLDHALTLQLGRSNRTNQPVVTELLQNFGPTVELGVSALAIALLVSVPIGIVAAVRRYSALDYLTMIAALFGVSMPVFWTGLVLIYLLSFRAGLFPITGILDSDIALRHITYSYVLDSILTANGTAFRSSLRHLILPAFTLSTIPIGIIARMTRSAMLDVLRSDYLQTARAKGLSERSVVLQHAVRNALIPVVTIVSLQLGGLLSGAFLIETVFGRPGVGRYIVTAISARDYPAIEGTVLVVAVVFVLVNLLVDLLYAYIDPRIHYA